MIARFIAGILLSELASISFANPSFSLSWPTPNPSFAQGLGYSSFIQKTGPDKEFSSGAFGCVRNNGYKFHEGVDLFPIKRTSGGQAEDKIFASISGVVHYINRIASHSAYGKYIVIEHPQLSLSIYSLYAHLSEIESKLKVGSSIQVANPIGKMGNTSSFRIPLSRSHLHFEIGLRLSNDFQSWFDKRNFKTPNRHKNYSGFNLVGIDPLPFFAEYQKKSFSTVLEYFKTLPVRAKVKIRSNKVPDFVERYPSLCPNFKKEFSSWDCSFGPYGIPLRLESSLKLKPEDPKIKFVSLDLGNDLKPCRKLAIKKGDSFVPTEQFQTYLDLLFGF